MMKEEQYIEHQQFDNRFGFPKLATRSITIHPFLTQLS